VGSDKRRVRGWVEDGIGGPGERLERKKGRTGTKFVVFDAKTEGSGEGGW